MIVLSMLPRVPVCWEKFLFASTNKCLAQKQPKNKQRKERNSTNIRSLIHPSIRTYLLKTHCIPLEALFISAILILSRSRIHLSGFAISDSSLSWHFGGAKLFMDLDEYSWISRSINWNFHAIHYEYKMLK